MDDTAHDRFPRVAPILLSGVLVWLAIARPGNLSGDSMPTYWLLTTLAAVAAVAYSAWRFHGLIPAAAALALLRFAEPDHPDFTAVLERASDAVFLLTLALGIGAASRQGRFGKTSWVMLTLVALTLAYFGWYGWELPRPSDSVARERMWQLTAGLAFLSVVVGLLTKRARWLDRLRLVGIVLVIPACGLVAARLMQHDTPSILDGGDWRSLPTEWQKALGNGDWANGAWAWSLPWVVLPLMLIGLWRTIVRGRKEWQQGRPPLAWLLTVASLATFVALAARPLASGSLVLAAIGTLLSVFGIADLIQALVERIALEPPKPGISDVPRVR